MTCFSNTYQDTYEHLSDTFGDTLEHTYLTVFHTFITLFHIHCGERINNAYTLKKPFLIDFLHNLYVYEEK